MRPRVEKYFPVLKPVLIAIFIQGSRETHFKSLIQDRKSGAPDGIRTHGPQIRNLMLYPAELRMLPTR